MTGETNDTLDLVLEPNLDRVAAELIEGDAIIIHVASGTYYNTQGIGGWIWECCTAGRTMAEIVTLGVGIYDVPKEQLECDLLAFAETLKAEDLVQQKRVELPAKCEEPVKLNRPYATPSLEIYRDLKDLLALDPPMPRMDLDAKFSR